MSKSYICVNTIFRISNDFLFGHEGFEFVELDLKESLGDSMANHLTAFAKLKLI